MTASRPSRRARARAAAAPAGAQARARARRERVLAAAHEALLGGGRDVPPPGLVSRLLAVLPTALPPRAR